MCIYIYICIYICIYIHIHVHKQYRLDNYTVTRKQKFLGPGLIRVCVS